MFLIRVVWLGTRLIAFGFRSDFYLQVVVVVIRGMFYV